jgi:UDP-3-O-[3-hydroxymyristoyl] glucosamine N-acyltransferase
MPAPTPNTPATTEQLAALLGAQLVGPGSIRIHSLESLEHAAPGQLSFIRAPRFIKDWTAGRASAAVVSRDVPLAGLADTLGDSRALLIVPDADLAVARLLELFAPAPALHAAGVHPTAVIDPTAVIAPTASIGPCCTVGPGAAIADGAVLVSHVHIGRDASVGASTTLHPHVSILDRCRVGARCLLHPGVVVGADGFGFRPSPDKRGVVKIPHIGNAVIGDDVEIGANSCIDRAKFGSTTIGQGTKIDNLVQVAHNVRIGRGCIICGQCGIAGSATLGDGVVLGGGAGVSDNVEIGAGARLAAGSAVISDMPAGATWMGVPAVPAGEFRRTLATVKRLTRRDKPE